MTIYKVWSSMEGAAYFATKKEATEDFKRLKKEDNGTVVIDTLKLDNKKAVVEYLNILTSTQ